MEYYEKELSIEEKKEIVDTLYSNFKMFYDLLDIKDKYKKHQNPRSIV